MYGTVRLLEHQEREVAWPTMQATSAYKQSIMPALNFVCHGKSLSQQISGLADLVSLSLQAEPSK